MHYFHNTVVSFWGLDPHRESIPGPHWRLSSRPLIYPPLEKILRAPMHKSEVKTETETETETKKWYRDRRGSRDLTYL